MPDMKFGEYEVVRLLGKGGMSEVYEVENRRLGSRHALKLYAYERDEQSVRERFLAEGRLLARLKHPRIVNVTDLGAEERSGRPYFVMDLVLDAQGCPRSLADVQPGMADEEEIGRWYDDLRVGLAYIHANGVIHRDLKLQNVLIGPDGHVVLTDFGISKIFDVKGDGKTIVDTVNTLAKIRDGRSLVMGSIGYMAPELEMGVPASEQSDYYALGVIVYRLLTGTWCDARTELQSALECYDPVWKRILPKLLHSNPNGRECLSYESEKQADRVATELLWEERWLKEKGRGHRARHVVRYAGALFLLVAIAVSWTCGHYRKRLDASAGSLNEMRARIAKLDAQLALPDFSDICKLPKPNPAKTHGRASWGAERASLGSLVDAWVLTHGIFEDLKKGNITFGKAFEMLEALALKADRDILSLFELDKGYSPKGDYRELAKILKNAVIEMKRYAPKESQP